MGVIIPILMDIKGPEIRIGQLKDASYDLQTGDRIVLTTEQIIGDSSRVSVNYPGLPQDVKPGNLVLIDDGSIELRVEMIDGTEVTCYRFEPCQLKQRKGVNLPGVRTSLPGVTERDVMHIKFGVEENISIVAMSFVRNGNDVREVRALLEQHGAGLTPIISKIENEEGMTNFASILEASDGIMVARGDLGVEIPTEEVPIAQKDMIRACNLAGKPVITATQMLDSMQRNPRPTRAEVSDVANAVLDGSDVVMLSGETAAGKYPIESVTMMATIAERVEQTMVRSSLVDAQLQSNNEITEVLCQAVVSSANKLHAAAILNTDGDGLYGANDREISSRSTDYRGDDQPARDQPIEHGAGRHPCSWRVLRIDRRDDSLCNQSSGDAWLCEERRPHCRLRRGFRLGNPVRLTC